MAAPQEKIYSGGPHVLGFQGNTPEGSINIRLHQPRDNAHQQHYLPHGCKQQIKVIMRDRCARLIMPVHTLLLHFFARAFLGAVRLLPHGP